MIEGANGLHLPDGCPAPSGVGNRLIGQSVHTVNPTVDPRCDYLIFGSIFATLGKKPQGLAALEAICRNLTLPVIAIGGIDGNNMKSCLQAGAAGVAMQREVTRCLREV